MANQVVFGRRSAPTAPLAPAAAKPAPIAAEPAPKRAHAKLYEETDGMERLLAGLPLVTLGLAALLGLVFLIEQNLAFDIGPGGEISHESILAFGALSRDLAFGQLEFWRLGLAPLLHGGDSHIIGNLIALTLVGIQLEPIIGRGWFAAIFAFSALGGEAGSLIGNAPELPSLGASGAITGVIAASFVMSFSADTAEESLRMLKRAVYFGGPALAPLLWASHDATGAEGGTDYYAHLGGALVGGVVAFVLDQTWNRVYFRPPFNGFAGLAAGLLLALATVCAAQQSRHYGDYETKARNFIPLADIEGGFLSAADRAFEFQDRYPNDPMTRLLLAVHYMKQERGGEAETELRAAMAAPTPLRPALEPFIHASARALLALVLQAERRGPEAIAIAEPLCGADALAKPKAMVVKAKLCRAG